MVKGRARSTRLIRGWYAVGAPDAQSAPWEAPTSGRPRERSTSARRRARSFEGRVVAARSRWCCTAHASGSRTWRPPTSAAATTTRTRRRPAAIHRRAVSQAVETADGFRAVPVATAVVQVGLERHGTVSHRSPSKPGRRRRSSGGLVTKEEARGGGQGAQQAPRHTWRARPPRPGGRVATSRSGRPGWRTCALGYRFTPQVWVSAGGRRWQADFVLDDDPVVVEFIWPREVLGRGCRTRVRSCCAGPSRRREVARGPAARHRT